MRISDWSSDVCSSDLNLHRAHSMRSDIAAGACRMHSTARGARPAQAILVDQRANARDGAISNNLLQISRAVDAPRSEEHTSELQSLMSISSAIFCLKKKTKTTNSSTHRSNRVQAHIIDTRPNSHENTSLR